MDKRLILLRAMQSGDILQVKYFGGNQYGLIRPVQVKSIDGNFVKVFCPDSSSTKLLKIEKLEVIPDEQVYRTNTITSVKLTATQRLTRALKPYEKIYSSRGWKLLIEEDEAGLYRIHKGKVSRKTPDILIQYHTERYVLTSFDEDGNTVDVTEPCTHPWYVRSNILNSAKSFSTLPKAIVRFNQFMVVETESTI